MSVVAKSHLYRDNDASDIAIARFATISLSAVVACDIASRFPMRQPARSTRPSVSTRTESPRVTLASRYIPQRSELPGNQKQALNALLRTQVIEVRVPSPNSFRTKEPMRIGLSQTERAARLGVDRTTVAEWDQEPLLVVGNPTTSSLPTHAIDKRGRPQPLHRSNFASSLLTYTNRTVRLWGMIQQEVARARRSRRKVTSEPRAIVYTRVSTEEQANSRAGLDAQRSALKAELERRGWADSAVWLEDAGYSAKSLDRPAIRQALDMLSAGEANVLMVAKLDRLSRSLLDFAALMDRAQRERWGVVALDLGVDTSTPSGEMMAAVLAAFAQYERRLIGERTKNGLAAKRAQGVRIGRPLSIPADVRARLAELRNTGASFDKIATQLNADGVPTARGGQHWYASTVQRALRAQEA